MCKFMSCQVTFDNVFKPYRLVSLAGVEITSVSCGSKHTCAMDSEGMLWTWGFGGYGTGARGRCSVSLCQTNYLPKHFLKTQFSTNTK